MQTLFYVFLASYITQEMCFYRSWSSSGFFFMKVETIKLHTACSRIHFSILHSVWYTLLIIAL